VRQLEAVYPESRQYSIVGLEALDVGRLEPTALVLDDGRILVGGGSFENGDPVGQVEWFSADGTDRRGAPAQLPQRPNRAFFALPGGGALSVPGCLSGTSCSPWEGSILTPDNEIVPFELPESTSCPIPERPLLVPGGGGVPLLIGVYDGAPPCVWRYNPWPADYTSESDPVAHPRFERFSIELDPPPDARVVPIATGSASFVYVASGEPGLVGVRVSSRGALSHELDSVTSYDSARPFRPERLVPDRPLATPDGEPRPFENVLTLRPSDASVIFWVADTRFEDATIDLDLAPASGGGDPRAGPPLLRFGSSAVGDGSCPWPSPDEDAQPEQVVSVRSVRRGSSVTLENAGRTKSCPVGPGSSAIGIGLGAVPTEVRSLTVQRD
jgi:hypothetical protein